MEKLTCSRQDAVKVSGLSLRTIDYYVEKGVLPSVRVGRRVLINYAALEELCRTGSKSARAAQQAETVDKVLAYAGDQP